MALRTLEFPFPNGTPAMGFTTQFTSAMIDLLTETPVSGDQWNCLSARLEITCVNNSPSVAFDIGTVTIGIGMGTTVPSAFATTEATVHGQSGVLAGTMMFSRDLTQWFNDTGMIGGSPGTKGVYLIGGGTGIGYTFSMTGSNGPPILTNFSAKIIITVQVSETNGPPTTRVNLVRIPMDCSNTDVALTTTTQSFALDSIPALNTLLPEAGKTIIAMWVEIEGNDHSNNAAGYTLGGMLDAIAVSATGMGTYTKGSIGNFFKSNYIIPASARNSGSAVMNTGVVLNLRASCSTGTKSALIHLSAVLHVVYSYNPATTTRVIVSTMMPIGHEQPLFRNNTIEPIKFNCQEGDPILVQSGVTMNWICSTNSTKPVRFRMNGQNFAPLTARAAGSITMAGQEQATKRFDAGAELTSGLTLVRGINTLIIDHYQTGQNQSTDTHNRPSMINFRVYLNYTCYAPYDHSPSAIGAYSYQQLTRTLFKSLCSTNVLQQNYEASPLCNLDVVYDQYAEDRRYYSNIAMDWRAFVFGEFANVKMGVFKMTDEIAPGDLQGFKEGGAAFGQWQGITLVASKSALTAICSFRQAITRHFLVSTTRPQSQGLDYALISRRYIIENPKDITIASDASLWETSHGIFYLSGGVVVNAGSGSFVGQIIDIFNANDEHIQEVGCNSAGAFNYTHHDDTVQYYGVARRGLKAGASLLSP